MIITGAKGFAKELLEVVFQSNPNAELSFHDEVIGAGSVVTKGIPVPAQIIKKIAINP